MEAVSWLQELIKIQSFSRQEEDTANYLEEVLSSHDLKVYRYMNNVWAYFTLNEQLPTLLLNSHHDTVKPGKGWTVDPFTVTWEGEKMIGLGSNDAGASLVSMMATFLESGGRLSKYNLVFAASAEEEISGENGIAAIIDRLPAIDMAIVGEPTELEAAVAEKGLMVVDCEAIGKSGHAARNEGLNAIDVALKDIQWLHSYEFSKSSETLGPVKMTATMIEAGSQHNVVPDSCRFTVDVRTTDAYSNEEVLATMRGSMASIVTPRSLRLQPSGVDPGHPLYQAVKVLNIPTYGSPTLSDQAQMPWPSLKLGPGDSARSHTSDEYILESEIKEGIRTYLKLIETLEETL
jgi:acetylornithine deacetylase